MKRIIFKGKPNEVCIQITKAIIQCYKNGKGTLAEDMMEVENG